MIFIGNFLVLTNQEKIDEIDRRHGEFNLIVAAPDAANALRLFRDSILDHHRNSMLFEGDCSIFMIQLLEFDQLPQERAMMMTYKSMAGDPIMPYIGCLVPSSDTDSCRIFNWKNNRPEIDGESEALFLRLKAGSEPAQERGQLNLDQS